MSSFLDKTGLTYLWSKIKSAFVTALGTSGNYLTWTKNGTTNNITVPYATNAGSATTATKVGSSTVGSSTLPVYINSGTPTVISSIPGYKVQGSGINSMINTTSGVGINPAINGAGMNIARGGSVRFLYDGFELVFKDNAQELLFDGLNSTYLCPFNAESYIVKDNYLYDSTKTYAEGDIVILNNSSNKTRWYRSLLDDNTGNTPTEETDNTYWEYISSTSANYAQGINPQKISKLEILVTLASAASYESGVSLYWRTTGQHPTYVTLEKYDSTFTESLGKCCENQNMTGETVTSIYCGLVSGANGNYFKFTFTGFNSNSYWALALTQMAFTGLIGGIERTVVMRKGGEYSAMFGDFYPNTNLGANLGTSSKKWANVYATTFNGNATSATKATQDASGNTITSTYATKTEVSAKQDTLTFDSTPTSSSTNPVTSGGVYSTISTLAPKDSPVLTGIPTAPTAAAGTNTTQIATTAFVTSAIATASGALLSKVYTGVVRSSTTYASPYTPSYFYFGKFVPTDLSLPAHITYHIIAYGTSNSSYLLDAIVRWDVSNNGIYKASWIWNSLNSTSYYPFGYHTLYCSNNATISASDGCYIGGYFGSSTSYGQNPTTVERTLEVEILEAENCTASLTDSVIFFDDTENMPSNLVQTSASNAFNTTNFTAVNITTQSGLQETGDANSSALGYNIRRNNGTYLSVGKCYRYMLLLSYSETQLLPINSTSNNTGTSKTLTTESFDPFGTIFYYSSTTTVNDGAAIAITSCWTQYPLDLRYSFNEGTTLTNNKDVYIVAVPQSNGRAVLANSPISQDLPTTEDGYIYIYLGHTYSTYNIVLSAEHPIYYYYNGALRPWTNSSYDQDEQVIAAALNNLNTTVNNKQDVLTFDTTPTSDSTNPVTSGGVYTALSSKQDTLESGTNIKTVNNESLLGSGNLSISSSTITFRQW